MSPNPPLALPAPDEATELLRLPYIMPAQAQKHVTHNEALRMLDALVHLAVASRTAAEPPAEPAPGERYIVPEGGEAAWDHAPGTLLAWQDGAWAAHEPRAGWVAWAEDEAALIAHDGTEWIEASGDSSPATLGVNATADDTNRLTVSAPATLLTHEGDDHRLTINKAGEPDTASLLFQSGWSGRAEMGLAGTDDFALKVSHDGAAWHEALVADGATGDVSFPGGANGGHLMPGLARAGGAGGEASAIGAPNMLTVSFATASMALATGRVHFAPVLIDRPTELEGAVVTLATAASGPGTMRAGLYALGGPEDDAWRPGALVADLGSASPEARGNVAFDLAAPVTLEPGWYLTALGTDAPGVSARYAWWLTPGTPLIAFGAGAGVDLRAVAMLLGDGQAPLIRSGYPAAWPGTLAPLETSAHYARQMVVPRWRRWGR